MITNLQTNCYLMYVYKKTSYNIQLLKLRRCNMSYQKLYSIISKPWLDTNEIKELCNCSTCSAITIRQEIEEKVKAMGKRLPISNHKVVPTQIALEHLGIDINYVYDMATKELNMKNLGVINEC